MSIPSDATNANCDDEATDDPKQALTVDLHDAIETLNTLLAHLRASGITLGGTTAAMGIGEGLESDGDAASPLLRAKVASTGGVSRGASGLSVDVAGLSSATPTQASTLAFEAGSGSKKARLAGSSTSLIAIAAATQAEMETPASAELVVTPARVHHHPGVAKAWVVFDGAGSVGALGAAAVNGVSAITKNATGDYTITWSVAFSSASYAVLITAEAGTGDNVGIAQIVNGGKAAGSVRIKFFNASSVAFDPPSVHVMAFGDQ